MRAKRRKQPGLSWHERRGKRQRARGQRQPHSCVRASRDFRYRRSIPLSASLVSPTIIVIDLTANNPTLLRAVFASSYILVKISSYFARSSMTVMLLQRSVTPQSTHRQKTAKKDCSAKPPFIFLLDDRQEHRRSIDASIITTTNNNNNNNNNNNIIINNFNNNYENNYTPTTNNNNNNNNNINNNNNNNNNYESGNKNNIVKRSVRRSSGSREYAVEEAPASVTSQRRTAGGQDVAMRYYRIWIYACNGVLFFSAAAFAAVVSMSIIFTGDPRRHVIPGVPRAFDPTALYAYLALGTQLGLVQLLGCVAVRRLSAKLLNVYWVLLLVLLFGDIVIGIVWVVRSEGMNAQLRPMLRLRLQTEYGKEPRFSEHWDRLQKEFTCCGVTGPRDFGSRWPQTCCGPIMNVSDTCQQPYSRGCDESLLRWLRETSDRLFVFGFCVVAFTKLCFLGILRYEIREMIQKIRMLREPPPPATTFAQPPFSQVMSEATTNNGSIVRRTTLPNAVTPSGNASLLLQTEECNTGRHPLLANNLQDGGADSDTNSHCALILEETTPTSANHNCGTREKSNGNNNYEMREFNRRLLLSNGGSPGTQGVTAGGQSRRT
ncbi:CD63 antigen [Vespula maculifrons]|uniref:CD63 antigen n=1 Tax=Vespula maculifrons TaxID=7453 RepID=A0ABD2CGG2_VESMC